MVLARLSNLRSMVRKRFRSFSCCAGCDALDVPVGNRLCVSIRPRWKADAVLWGEWPEAELTETVASIRTTMPWLRRIYVQPSGLKSPGQDVHILPKGLEEADLHRVKNLGEHFIVFLPTHLPATPLLPADFFTPNGIPLLFVKPGGSAEAPNFLPYPAGRTKSLCTLFAEAHATDTALADCHGMEKYALAFARWAYTEQHGILSLCSFGA